jgi:hypothetical protein
MGPTLNSYEGNLANVRQMTLDKSEGVSDSSQCSDRGI